MPANPPVPRDNGRAQGKQSVFFPIVAALLLLLMAVLAGGAARRESATFDEPTHIGAGVSYLQRLDLRLNEEHPPLAKVLAALPLVIRGVRADYSTPSWIMSKEFFPAYFGQVFFGASVQTRWNDPATTLAWARAPMLLLTLALGWIVFVYGRRLGGGWGGLLCLSLYVAMPVFLTFGPLVLTDLAITLFSLTTLWTFAGVWREPSRGNVMRFALNLAGALLSKFSAGILFFAFAAFTLSTLWRPVPGQPGTKPEARAWRRLRRRATWSGILWAALFVYVVYFILSLRQPTDSLDRLGHWPAAAILRRLLMPPWLYLRGLFMLAITSSRPTFILSHAYKHGVWFYFPVVFLFKSPLGFLGLLVLAIAVALHRRRREPGGPSVIPAEWGLHWRALWTSLIVFTAVCMASRLDISFRHFTIPVVLLILMLAPLPQMLKRLRASAPAPERLTAALAAVMALCCLFTAVRTYPYYFPYVNALSFEHPAYTLVNDANVDWGQAMPEVARFAEQRGLQRIEVDSYGLFDPSVVAPQARLWNCQQPTPADQGQWVVLSANMILDTHNCAWIMEYPHEALAGGSMYAVQLPAPIPAAGSPGGPPLPSDQREFFGAPVDIRVGVLDLVDHPEKLPAVLAAQGAAFSGANQD